MEFFFKKSKIVVDCFTDNHLAFEHAKINHAHKFLPEWWKNLPKKVDVSSKKLPLTMKSCPGFIDLYKKNLVLPNWSEIVLSVNPDKSFSWKTASAVNIQWHEQREFAGLFSNSPICHVKIVSPWFIKTKDDLQLMVSEPFWNNEHLSQFRVTPGIINAKYNMPLNINGFIETVVNDIKIVKFKPLSPLAFITPLTEKDIELRHHLVDSKRVLSFRESFHLPSLNGFRKRAKVMDTSTELNKPESKCPFGFKKS